LKINFRGYQSRLRPAFPYIDTATLAPPDGGKPGTPGVCPWAADKEEAKRL